jgi:hypothetical protein
MKAYESLGQTFVAVGMISKRGEFPVTSQMPNSDHVPHAPKSTGERRAIITRSIHTKRGTTSCTRPRTVYNRHPPVRTSMSGVIQN